MVNLGVCLLISYIFEWYISKDDPFLKLPFDSGYYSGQSLKYTFLKLDFNPYNPYITWGHKTRKNKYGYRGPEISLKKDSAFRIVVFGDSFTWGAGLEENERYTEQLDSTCKLHYKNVEVLNFGLMGAHTVREKDSLVRLIGNIKPAMIIFGFCFNDLQPKSESYSIEREKFDLRYGNILKILQEFFTLLHLPYIGANLNTAITNLAERNNAFPPWHIALGRTYNKNSGEWNNFVQALRDIKAVSDSSHCAIVPAFIIFRQLGLIDFDLKSLSEDEQDKMRYKLAWAKQVFESAQNAGLIAIDSQDGILKQLNSGNLRLSEFNVSQLDGHPSAKINKIFSEDLFNGIRNKLDSCSLILKKY